MIQYSPLDESRPNHVGAGLLRRGIYAAVDLKTNKIVWQRQFNDGCRSGSLATAGGVLFMGRTDGRLIALDMRNGERLCSLPLQRAALRQRQMTLANMASCLPRA